MHLYYSVIGALNSLLSLAHRFLTVARWEGNSVLLTTFAWSALNPGNHNCRDKDREVTKDRERGRAEGKVPGTGPPITGQS